MTSSKSSNSISKTDGEKWPQILVVFIASIAVFATGLHVGWSAPSLPQLFSDDYPFDVSAEEGSYITIIRNLGAFFGSFIGNFILDKIGRRICTILIAVPQIVSFLAIILSYQIMELLYVGRFIGGLAEGMVNTVIIIYVAEIAQPSIRGILGVMTGVAWYFGTLFANIIGSYLSIRTTAGICIAFPVLFIVLFWRMPESPYYLLMKKKDEDAERILKFLLRKPDVNEELIRLQADVVRQMSETGTFRDIFTIDSNRRAFYVTVGARFFQLTTGVAAMNFYIQILLKEATQSIAPHVDASIILLIQLGMTVLNAFVVDRWGRKPLLLFSTIGCFVNLVLQMIFFILKEHTSVDTSVVDWFPLVMMMVLIAVYSIGLGSVVSVLTSEMFSASIKAKLICMVNGSFSLLTLAVTKYYQATADGFGLTVPFSSFVVLTFVEMLFFYYLVPETKGKTLEQIQQKLKGDRKEKNTFYLSQK
ncbi:facilitated trehalose transporter Tret1-2 homolog [Zophobas morio]|uniref:facilitated trehalose transporter Tret1-2 homolog n=1 Tax=Zophobas morio TaxID=2755281 RepID=UPI003082CE42